jgi:flagellar hook assembly protein FlgD
MTGIPVRNLVTDESRNAGLNTQDTWDGRNDSGRMVLNGVYLAVLEVNASGTKSTVKRFVAVVK